jgi:hypothetical protein
VLDLDVQRRCRMQDMGSESGNVLAARRVADQQPVDPRGLCAPRGIGKPEAVDAPFAARRLQEVKFRNVRSAFAVPAGSSIQPRLMLRGNARGRRQWPMTPKTSAAANATETKKVRVSAKS